MAEAFARAVEDGLRLGKRVYMGKDRAVAPPKPLPLMDKSPQFYLPSAPMVYAVISDPRIVDNPDIPSYQPYVHGRLDTPALIPLQMSAISLDVDCFVDTAFVLVSGTWRVHCVMGSRSCDCRIAVPMGEQGTFLGVEVDLPKKSYSTEQIGVDEIKGIKRTAKPEDAAFVSPYIFTITIPKINGGTYVSIKLHWSQKLSYIRGQLTLTVPFTFPDFVNPAVKKIARKEKIQLNVNYGIETGMVQTTSHPFKEFKRESGDISFVYEANVLTWSETDLSLSYIVSSSNIFGGALLQSPPANDLDQRDMFCIYLFPGNEHIEHSAKGFSKEVIFVLDISASMRGKSLESTKNAMNTAFSKLSPEDSFNIILFCGETFLFCTSMMLASQEAVERAYEWILKDHGEGAGTDIFVPLQKAIEMLTYTHGSMPMVFLVTDGAVEDERKICEWMSKVVKNGESLCPRIHTFGIGSFCNHHFLRMLSMISHGEYAAAFDLDSIQSKMQKLISIALSSVLANITLDGFEQVEVYSSCIPDLSSEAPLMICGRYEGRFPDTLKAEGIIGDSGHFAVNLKIEKTTDMPLDKVIARQQIDLLTAQAWFSDNKQLQEQIVNLCMRTCNMSEYSRMILVEKSKIGTDMDVAGGHKWSKKRRHIKVRRLFEAVVAKPEKVLLQLLTTGFGNLVATAENIPPVPEEDVSPEVIEILNKAATNFWDRLCKSCCCVCCIQCCSKMNNTCGVVISQILAALAYIGCRQCCSLCFPEDGQ